MHSAPANWWVACSHDTPLVCAKCFAIRRWAKSPSGFSARSHVLCRRCPCEGFSMCAVICCRVGKDASCQVIRFMSCDWVVRDNVPHVNPASSAWPKNGGAEPLAKDTTWTCCASASGDCSCEHLSVVCSGFRGLYAQIYVYIFSLRAFVIEGAGYTQLWRVMCPKNTVLLWLAGWSSLITWKR